MAFITWTAAISVNAEIDAQHMKLFDILNEIHVLVTEGSERGALAKVFNELIDYTIYHFQTEERCFAELAYPDARVHKKEHDELTAQVVALQSQFVEGDLVISFELLDFLYDWLMKHTSDSDIKFRKFLDGRGGRGPTSGAGA